MKKFTKISLILAAVLAASGVVLFGIASVMCGGYGALRKQMRESEIHHGNWHITADGIYYSDEEWENETNDSGDVSASGGTEHGSNGGSAVTDNGKSPYTYETAEVKNLRIDIDAAAVYVQEGERADAVVVYMSGGKETYYSGEVSADGTLEIVYDYQFQGIHISKPDTEIRIEIPAGMKIAELELDFDAADAELDFAGMTCKDLALSTDAADAAVENLTVTWTANLAADAGKIETANGSYQDVEIACNMGNVSMEGEIGGNITASTSMGSIELAFAGDPDAYDYQVSYNMGEVRVNGREYSGISAAYETPYADTTRLAELECDMGSIDLNIQK